MRFRAIIATGAWLLGLTQQAMATEPEVWSIGSGQGANLLALNVSDKLGSCSEELKEKINSFLLKRIESRKKKAPPNALVEASPFISPNLVKERVPTDLAKLTNRTWLILGSGIRPQPKKLKAYLVAQEQTGPCWLLATPVMADAKWDSEFSQRWHNTRFAVVGVSPFQRNSRWQTSERTAFYREKISEALKNEFVQRHAKYSALHKKLNSIQKPGSAEPFTWKLTGYQPFMHSIDGKDSLFLSVSVENTQGDFASAIVDTERQNICWWAHGTESEYWSLEVLGRVDRGKTAAPVFAFLNRYYEGSLYSLATLQTSASSCALTTLLNTNYSGL